MIAVLCPMNNDWSCEPTTLIIHFFSLVVLTKTHSPRSTFFQSRFQVSHRSTHMHIVRSFGSWQFSVNCVTIESKTCRRFRFNFMITQLLFIIIELFLIWILIRILTLLKWSVWLLQHSVWQFWIHFFYMRARWWFVMMVFFVDVRFLFSCSHKL